MSFDFISYFYSLWVVTVVFPYFYSSTLLISLVSLKQLDRHSKKSKTDRSVTFNIPQCNIKLKWKKKKNLQKQPQHTNPNMVWGNKASFIRTQIWSDLFAVIYFDMWYTKVCCGTLWSQKSQKYWKTQYWYVQKKYSDISEKAVKLIRY